MPSQVRHMDLWRFQNRPSVLSGEGLTGLGLADLLLIGDIWSGREMHSVALHFISSFHIFQYEVLWYRYIVHCFYKILQYMSSQIWVCCINYYECLDKMTLSCIVIYDCCTGDETSEYQFCYYSLSTCGWFDIAHENPHQVSAYLDECFI